MNHNEMIAVIDAHRDGKKLECKAAYDERSKWTPLGVIPAWNFSEYEYRIAVEPRRCWVAFMKDGTEAIHKYTGKDYKGDPLSDSEMIKLGWQLVVEDLTNKE